MKKFFILLLLIVLSSGSYAQVLDSTPEQKGMETENEDEKEEIQTLFGKDRSNGGYFDIYFNYTELKNSEALEAGSRISLIIGHSLGFGIEGTGFVSNIIEDGADEYILAGGYGGFTIEPIILPKFPVHVSLPVMLGGGVSVYSMVDTDNEEYSYVEEVEGFLLARPGMEIEFNVTRYFRFCLNGSYRFIADVGPKDNRSVTASDLDGFSFGFSFKLGKF